MPAKNLTNSTGDIWRQGVPLKDAVSVYATDDEAATLAKLPGPLLFHEMMAPISQTLLAVGMAVHPDLRDHPEKAQFERYAREAKQLLEKRKAVAKEIQDWLIAELQNARLELYGYAVPRHPKDRPVKIPADLYEARFINWEGSRVEGNALAFVAVLMVEIETAPQIDIKPDDKLRPLFEHQKHVPISAQTAIEATIRYMIDNDLLPHNAMQKQLIPLIREYIHKRYPDEFPRNHGLSNESIRMVLAPLTGKPTIQ